MKHHTDKSSLLFFMIVWLIANHIYVIRITTLKNLYRYGIVERGILF